MRSEGSGGSWVYSDIAYDEENPPHPDDRIYASRNDHWSRVRQVDISHLQPPPIPKHWRSYKRKGLCWCGEQFGHDWPGKDSGRVHPPKHDGTLPRTPVRRRTLRRRATVDAIDVMGPPQRVVEEDVTDLSLEFRFGVSKPGG